MGKRAEPGVDYCGINGNASLSIGNQTFGTDKPPIRYDPTTGNGAVISDSTGVIGNADLTGLLEESGRTEDPAQDTYYWGGSAAARLEWDGGSVETQDPPISFDVVDPQPCTKVFYSVTGNGFNNFSSSRLLPKEIKSATSVITTISNYVATNCQSFDTVSFGYIQGDSGDTRPLVPLGGTTPESYVPGCHSVQSAALRSCYTSQAYYQTYYTMDRYGIAAISVDDGSVQSIVIDDVVPGGTDYIVRVYDASGLIAQVNQQEDPTDFVAIGYDFDEAAASYACEGECPSGTEYQCRCPETNQLYCYGFDPSNENVFRSLHTSPIVG